MVRQAGRRQEKTNTRPKLIITAENVVIKVGAFAWRGCKFENWFSLPDMVPRGELKHYGECDKTVNLSNTEAGGLEEDVQIERQEKEERTEDEHEGKDEQPTGQHQRLQIVRWNWWKTPGTSKRPVYSRTGNQL